MSINKVIISGNAAESGMSANKEKTMSTNEERREIAAKLRKTMLTEGATIVEEREGLEPAVAARFVAIPNLIAALNFNKNIVSIRELTDRLADLIEPESINGETSDGYHTFNELYHHRAVLFSVVVRNYPELCWKSKKHHTGDMYDGMFIVGINTPDGQASYHYDIEPYWDMFECEELEFAPEWDGHTPDQAIERIGKLKYYEKEHTCKNIATNADDFCCSKCNAFVKGTMINGFDYWYPIGKALNNCPNCGAKVVKEVDDAD